MALSVGKGVDEVQVPSGREVAKQATNEEPTKYKRKQTNNTESARQTRTSNADGAEEAWQREGDRLAQSID